MESLFGNIWVYDLQRSAHRNRDLGWQTHVPTIKETESGSFLIDGGPFRFEAPAGTWVLLSSGRAQAYAIKLNEHTKGTCFDFVVAKHEGKYYMASAFNFDLDQETYRLCKIARIPRGGIYLVDDRDPSSMYPEEVHDIVTHMLNFDFGETFNR